MRNVSAVRLSAAVVFMLLLSPAVSAAQQRGSTELGEAFELERRGRYEVASRRYRDILERSPTNLSALLGLERVLPPINQLDSILPYIDSALVLQPEHGSVRALQVRVFATLDSPDRLTEAARAWIAAMPLIVPSFNCVRKVTVGQPFAICHHRFGRKTAKATAPPR